MLKISVLLDRLSFDRAVMFGILSRCWSLISGPVTALLITTNFTPELQGYYYTFLSIIALQIFAELGLGTVIIQFASHEWAKLSLNKSGQIIGESAALSRLGSLLNFVLKWYFVGGLILTLGLGVGGLFFFSRSANNINWFSPWLTLCFMTGLNICCVPVWSVLEGCNQVKNVYKYRFIQGVISSFFTWIAISFGFSLWALSISSIVTFVCAIVFFRNKYWIFLKTLLNNRLYEHRILWNKEILPMQWRIAISWISGYFVFLFVTPVVFKYHGPIAAGQIGVSFTLTSFLGSIATAWLYPNVPKFGIFIAKKEYGELDNLFWRITKIVSIATLIAALLFFLLILIINELNMPLAKRLLPPFLFGIFILSQVIAILTYPFSSYLRAHKKEPLLVLSITQGILTALVAIIIGKFSLKYMLLGFLSINLIILPWVIIVWLRSKKKWHFCINKNIFINLEENLVGQG